MASRQREVRKRPAIADGSAIDDDAALPDTIVKPRAEDDRRATVAEKRQAKLSRAKFCSHAECGRVYVDGPGHKHHNPGHILRDVSISELTAFVAVRPVPSEDGVWKFPHGRHQGLTIEDLRG